MHITATTETDYTFGKLCNFITPTDLEIPITVLTGGVFISGNLVSGHKFFPKFREHIQAISEGKNQLTDRWRMFKIMIEAVETNVLDTEVTEPCPNHYYIANATVHKGNPRKAINPKEIFWRGKIDEIAGFYLDFAQ